jgi:hypothetical protein
MVVLVLDNVEKLDDVLNAWWDAGAPGITILESAGAARHLARSGARDDLPIFPSLSTLFAHGEIHHRTLFAVLPDAVPPERLFDATEAVLGPLAQPHTGIIFALPLLAARGHERSKNGS